MPPLHLALLLHLARRTARSWAAGTVRRGPVDGWFTVLGPVAIGGPGRRGPATLAFTARLLLVFAPEALIWDRWVLTGRGPGGRLAAARCVEPMPRIPGLLAAVNALPEPADPPEWGTRVGGVWRSAAPPAG